MTPPTICTRDLYQKNSLIARSESNSCTVYAFAAAFNVAFDEAYKVMALGFRRKPGRGLSTQTLVQTLQVGFTWKDRYVSQVISLPTTYYKSTGMTRSMTLTTFAKIYNQGTYYVLITGHALVVKDGVVLDNLTRTSLRKTVMFAFKVDDLGDKLNLSSNPVTGACI